MSELDKGRTPGNIINWLMRLEQWIIELKETVITAVTGDDRYLTPTRTLRQQFVDGDTTPSAQSDFWNDTFEVANTAATTITYFDDAFEGQVITLFFANANTTIAHDSTKIFLIGGANITPAANSLMTLRLVSGVWRQIAAGGADGPFVLKKGETPGGDMTGRLKVTPIAGSTGAIHVVITDPANVPSGGSAVLIEGDKPTGGENLYYLLRLRDSSVPMDWWWLRSDGAWVTNVSLNYQGGAGPASISSGAAIRFTTGGSSSGDIEVDTTISNGTGKHITLMPGGCVYLNKTDAVTAAITDVFIVQHNSTGTPAAGFGSAILFRGKSSTTNDRDMARFGTEWETATDANRKSIANISAFDGGTEKKNLQVKTAEVLIPVDLNVDGALLLTYQDSLAAAGTTQGTAAAITAENVEVTSITAGVNDGVRLPSLQPGRKITVFNRGGATLKVWPASGQSIEGLGVNNNDTIANSRAGIFVAFSGGWRKYGGN